ncbi:alpha/beta fold hydrolase [Mycoplasmopsis sturni]|uniref:alpha/beta fold hydrolase n=1 Tax=Mycoplasmopsis sturni TaxID=39047 RepID=UPI00055A051B|nr:alpha/beta hydrolase [Mycoplasmopsis sturni]
MIGKFIYKNLELETLEINSNSDKTIFLIHGFTADFNNLKTITETYQKDFNIYSINLPAHGKSPATEEVMTLENYINILVGFIKEKDLKNIYLVGHSMGGLLASLIVNKIENRVVKTLLIAPANLTSIEIKDKLEYAFSNTTLWSKITFLRLSTHNMFKFLFDKKFKAASAKWWEEHKQYTSMLTKLGRVVLDKDVLIKEEEELKKYKKPLAILYGRSDQIIYQKKIGAYYLKIKPSAQLYVIPKCGHNPWRENKKGVISALNEFFYQK